MIVPAGTPPVHTSEVKNYINCLLKWFWSAPPPRGRGLEPKVLQTPLNIGRVVHKALQDGYDKQLPFTDTYEQAKADCLAGIESPDEELLKDLETCEVTVEGYGRWAERVDKQVQFLATETRWGDVEYRGVPLAGRFDAILKRPDGVWIVDFKTTRYMENPWTTTDLQATVYTWAARQLYGPKVRGLIFRFLRKKKPWNYEDLVLKSGKVTERKDLKNNTTYEEYIYALGVAALKHLAENDFIFAGQLGLESTEDVPLWYYRGLLDGSQKEKEWYPEFAEAFKNVQRMYYQTIQELKGFNSFYWEVEEPRTDQQIERYMKFLVYPVAKRILQPKKWVGPTGLGSFNTCQRCQFKDPCKLAMDGADFMSLLQSEYRLRDIYEPDYEDQDLGQDV